MSGWGIAETAPVIEEIKAESADYLTGLNSCGEITWNVYDKAFDFYMELISRAYEQGKKDALPEIIRCKDCRWWGRKDVFKDGSSIIVCKKGWSGDPDGFCHNAERREE